MLYRGRERHASNGALTMLVYSPAMQATLAALGTFAALLGASSWLAERVCRAREARAARAALVARARS
jgi:hypothetical protein